MQKFIKEILGLTPVKKKEAGLGREKVGCSVVTRKASADPRGNVEGGIAQPF